MKQVLKSHKARIGGLVILVVVVVGAVAYLFNQHSNSSKKSSTDPTAYSLVTKNLVLTDTPKNRQKVINDLNKVDLSQLTNAHKAEHYSQLASAQTSNNDCKRALNNYQKALQYQTDLPGVYVGMARCNTQLGNKAEAKSNYQKALELYQAMVSQDKSVTDVINQVKSEEVNL